LYDGKSFEVIREGPSYRDGQPATARFTTVDPVNYVDPWGLQCSANDERNNNPPPSFYGNGASWHLMPEDKDVYHEQDQPYNGIDPKNNNKYVSTDGHQEGVYDQNGNLVTDPVNMGTYNISDPNTNTIGHFFNDVLPYWVNGNSSDDPTKWYERIFGTYNGPVPGYE
jgi:hypothetical protein